MGAVLDSHPSVANDMVVANPADGSVRLSRTLNPIVPLAQDPLNISALPAETPSGTGSE